MRDKKHEHQTSQRTDQNRHAGDESVTGKMLVAERGENIDEQSE